MGGKEGAGLVTRWGGVGRLEGLNECSSLYSRKSSLLLRMQIIFI